LRVIAGQYEDKNVPAETFSPINIWDVKLKKDYNINFTLTPNYTTLILVIKGDVLINKENKATHQDLIIFEPEGNEIGITANKDTTLLFLHAEPLNESVATKGPFAMNAMAEIRQAERGFSMVIFNAIFYVLHNQIQDISVKMR
jgi:quercetin 2,3-dioxygenase